MVLTVGRPDRRSTDVLEDPNGFAHLGVLRTVGLHSAEAAHSRSQAVVGAAAEYRQHTISTRCTHSGFSLADSLHCTVGEKPEEVGCSRSPAGAREGLGVGMHYTLPGGCHWGQRRTTSEVVGADVRVLRGTVVLLERGPVVVWGRRTIVVWWRVATGTLLLASPVSLSREEGHDCGMEASCWSGWAVTRLDARCQVAGGGKGGGGRRAVDGQMKDVTDEQAAGGQEGVGICRYYSRVVGEDDRTSWRRSAVGTRVQASSTGERKLW